MAIIRLLFAAAAIFGLVQGAVAQPTALSEKEIQNVTALVREAMGFSQQRGDSLNVVNAQFSTPDIAPVEQVPAWKQPDVIAKMESGSVKIDPTFVSGTGNATARITVVQQVAKNATLTYATNVNSTAQQLIQGEVKVTRDISLLAVRDEAGVFSLILRLHRRYR